MNEKINQPENEQEKFKNIFEKYLNFFYEQKNTWSRYIKNTEVFLQPITKGAKEKTPEEKQEILDIKNRYSKIVDLLSRSYINTADAYSFALKNELEDYLLKNDIKKIKDIANYIQFYVEEKPSFNTSYGKQLHNEFISNCLELISYFKQELNVTIHHKENKENIPLIFDELLKNKDLSDAYEVIEQGLTPEKAGERFPNHQGNFRNFAHETIIDITKHPIYLTHPITGIKIVLQKGNPVVLLNRKNS